MHSTIAGLQLDALPLIDAGSSISAEHLPASKQVLCAGTIQMTQCTMQLQASRQVQHASLPLQTSTD